MRRDSTHALSGALFGSILAAGSFRLSTGCGTEDAKRSDAAADAGTDPKSDSSEAALDADAGEAAQIDGGWTSMGWPAGCSLEWQGPSSIAKQAWEGCGVGGCSKLKVDYVHDDFEPFTSANVGSNAATRLRLLFIRRKSPKFESWYLTLRDDGTPVQLLRSFDCAPFLALGPTSRVRRSWKPCCPGRTGRSIPVWHPARTAAGDIRDARHRERRLHLGALRVP